MKTVSGSSLSLDYDGDGARAKSTQFGGAKYYVRSTLMGGAVIEEVNGSGTKEQGFVYQGNSVLAEQAANGFVSMVLEDPSGTSIRRTDSSGNVWQWNELDPMGVEAEHDDPYLILEEEEQYIGRGETGSLDRSYGNMAYPSDGCTLDGVYVPCEMASRAGSSGAAGVQADVYIKLKGVSNPLHWRGVVDASLAGLDIRWTGSQGAAGAMNFYEGFQRTGSVEAGINAAFTDKYYRAVDRKKSAQFSHARGQVRTPLTVQEVNDIQDHLWAVLSIKDCHDFVSRTLERLKEITGRQQHGTTNAMDLFNAVKVSTGPSNGFTWRVMEGAAARAGGGPGRAGMEIDPGEVWRNSTIGDRGRVMLHELFHVAGYDHDQVAQAMFDVGGRPDGAWKEWTGQFPNADDKFFQTGDPKADRERLEGAYQWFFKNVLDQHCK